MSQLKHLTPANWLEPDDALKPYIKDAPAGAPIWMTEQEWVNAVLRPILADSVPPAIRDLFAVAQGTLVYGIFFYPLYTLAAEQLFRVADAAVTHKYTQAGEATKRDFNKRIDWLAKHNVISPTSAERWHNIRKLRNITSHPIAPIFVTPSMAISVLEGIVADINDLFGAP